MEGEWSGKKQLHHRHISDESSAIAVFQKELDPPEMLQASPWDALGILRDASWTESLRGTWNLDSLESELDVKTIKLSELNYLCTFRETASRTSATPVQNLEHLWVEVSLQTGSKWTQASLSSAALEAGTICMWGQYKWMLQVYPRSH